MKKITAFLILIVFTISCVMPPNGFAQGVSAMGLMPEPGVQVGLTAMFTPSCLKGMKIDPNDPFKFDFIVLRGDEQLTAEQKQVEYPKLIKYFLAALAVPDTDQWVNLSPYEQDRVIPDNFGLTEMGRDLLAQDYLLKQISASLTNPDTDLGKKFWDGVYAQAYEKFGTTDIPTDTFNKVWIIPDKAVVYEKGNTVVVIEHHLKVMMEADYVAMSHATAISSRPENAPEDNDAVKISKQVMRDVIIPAIEKEANEGKNFAPLRQVYSGMLLATWYKRALKESILGKLYADQGKVKGIDQDPAGNRQIYEQYVKAFQKGVFNMIKEDVDQYTQELIPRKYFSGGLSNDYSQLSVDNSQVGAEKADVVLDNDNAEIVLTKMVEGASKNAWDGRLSQEHQLGNGADASQNDLGQNKKLVESILRAKHVDEQVIQAVISRGELKTSISIVGLLRSRLNVESAKKVSAAEELFYRLQRGDFEALGFDQFDKVLWHAIEHVIDNDTVETLKALINKRPDVSTRALVIVAVACILHDVGYFKADALYGTIKVGHEQRSKDFVAEFARNLGLSSKEVGLIRLVISATQASGEAAFFNELQAMAEEVMQDPARTVELDPMLEKAATENYAGILLEINTQDKEDLQLLTEVIDGLKFLAALDIRDTTPTAIKRMGDLHDEFDVDGERLKEYLGTSDAQMQEMRDYRNRLNTLTKEIDGLKKAIDELKKKIDELKMDKLKIDVQDQIDLQNKINDWNALKEKREELLGEYSNYKESLRKAKEEKTGRSVDVTEYDQGIEEYFKLVVAPTKARQVAGTEGFNFFYADGRVKAFIGENGWEEWISQEGRSGYDVQNGWVKKAAKGLRDGEDIDAWGELKELLNADGAESASFTKGGIDLNSASLDLQIRRDGAGIPLPVSQQNLENIRIDGLVPVILDIKPAVGTGFLN